MTAFTKRAKAYEYLRGYWAEAVTAQILVFLFELILTGFVILLPGNTTVNLCCALLIDLLMVSPLKAGRALFFETLVADKSAASVGLLFRYYKYGYSRTVGWRLLIWTYRILCNAVFAIPSFILFAFSGVLDSPFYTDIVMSMTLFGFGLLLLICAVVVTECCLLRLIAVPYLFAHTGTLRDAIRMSRHITGGRNNTLLSLYLDHAIWVFFIPLIIPWFFLSTVFQTARAATIRRFLRDFPAKNTPSVLQRRKKCDRIGR